MYFIVCGKVDILLDGYEGREGSGSVATREVGDIFGEMAAFNDIPRSATTRSNGLTTILRLDLHRMIHRPAEGTASNLAIKTHSHIAESLCRKVRHMNKMLLH